MQKTQINKSAGAPTSGDMSKLCEKLGCGRFTAEKIAKEAEARIQIGRRVLYNFDKIDRYLESISE